MVALLTFALRSIFTNLQNGVVGHQAWEGCHLCVAARAGAAVAKTPKTTSRRREDVNEVFMLYSMLYAAWAHTGV